MTTFIIILMVVGFLVSTLETLCIICMAIKAYNLHKYGYWWGKLPNWAENIVDKFSI